MLYAELDSASNGAISRWGHRWKTWWFTLNIDFFFRFFTSFYRHDSLYYLCCF